MRRFFAVLFLTLVACENSVKIKLDTPEVQYFVWDGRLACINNDAKYLRDVNADGVYEQACWWDCAYSTEYGVVGAYEAHYFQDADFVGLSYYADCGELL